MVPTAGDYIVTTFFYPPILRGRTTLVPPLLRPEVVAAVPERGEHLLVYSGGSHTLMELLHGTGMPCRVYGMRDGPEAGTTDGVIEFRPRSVDGFLEDLRTARAVVTGGGFSLLSEAVDLGKPTLAVPLHGQFEQLMNARYLQREGYGLCAPEVDKAALGTFLDALPEYERALEGYDRAGNEFALRTIEDTVTAAGADDRRRRRQLRRLARRAAE